MPAYSLDPLDVWGLSFIAVWRNSENDDLTDDVDVDLNLTFPTSWSDTSFADPYESTLSESGITRGRVYWGTTTAASGAITLDNDTTMFPSSNNTFSDLTPYGSSNPQLPETITMVNAPHTSTTTTSAMAMAATDPDANGLRAAFGDEVSALGLTAGDITWGWLGTAEAYLDAFNSSNSGTNLSSLYTDTSGDQQFGADAVLYVIQTLPNDTWLADTGKGSTEITQSDLTYKYLGAYRVPAYTSVSTASMVRINMLEDNDGYVWFQIVPDIRTVQEGVSLSADSTGIIGVRGRQR